jgi:hypothetical protein
MWAIVFPLVTYAPELREYIGQNILLIESLLYFEPGISEPLCLFQALRVGVRGAGVG